MRESQTLAASEKRLWIMLGVILLLMILPGVGAFPYPGNGQMYSDYATTHYPYAKYLIDSIVEFGEIPLWSDQIYSGIPFFANPQAGIWYPLYWVGYLFPLPLGFTIVIGIHLLLGLTGMKKFLQEINITGIPAVVGTAAFLLMPKLWAHFGAGHLTFFCGLMWLPWLLYLSRSASRKWYWAWAQPALILALIFLVASQWVLYAGLLWGAWVLFKRVGTIWQRLLYLAAQGLLALLLAMPLLLPMLEIIGYSSRQMLTAADSLYLSLPWRNLIGLVLPAWNPSHEWVIFPGMTVVVLAVSTVFTSERWRKTWFWWLVVGASALFAFGENLPWNAWLVQLPGLSLLRIPTRGLFLAGFALTVLAAYGLQHLSVGNFKHNSKFRLTALAILPTALVLMTAFSILAGADPSSFVFPAILYAVLLLWIIFRGRLSKYWEVGILILLLLELTFSSASMFRFRPVDEVFAEGGAAAEYLSQDAAEFRVYSPSYSIPEHTAVRWGLKLADGNDPMQLLAYVQFMEAASGVPAVEYAPTIPAFDGGDLTTTNKDHLPDLELLGWANVKYIASAFPLELPNLLFHGVFDDVYIYENLLVRSKAYVENGADWTAAEVISQMPNKAAVRAAGPGNLVISAVNYPGWQITIDGKAADFKENLFMRTALEAGDHIIEVEFKPPTFWPGLAGGLVGLLVLGAVSVYAYTSSKNTRTINA